jgi:transcriptional regulator with XRE-family HTH domain
MVKTVLSKGANGMYRKLTMDERLKDLRVVDKHLTLEQLAEQTGLSKSALGKYESDDCKDISPFAITKLAEFYNLSAKADKCKSGEALPLVKIKWHGQLL